MLWVKCSLRDISAGDYNRTWKVLMGIDTEKKRQGVAFIAAGSLCLNFHPFVYKNS